ncbi:MAG: carboxylating nicotinate-nucleotide diphosphorylase [Bacillota bacterium]|jgi:nicotinate-nucleotide pyrophosphorylase (carboxylating)|nr:carboxylating nicotinate-nucleotide diphosphorylase [Thermoanaerobacteraceae bacterium]
MAEEIFFGLDELVDRALREDLGTGDLTTLGIVPEGVFARGVFLAKEEGVVAGLPVAARVFRRLDPESEFRCRVEEGTRVAAGTILAEVVGRARAVLCGERVALNFMRHLSGIATRTARMVALVQEFQVLVTDTRKTTPGLRALEKYAVRVGGGKNHRFGLYDGVLIKDNHIRIAGGVKEAVRRVRESMPHTLKIEVEAESLAQVEEALAAGADVIMLDNMPLETMREAVRLVAGRALVEASGGITEENIRAVAATGVDLVSAGALTHSVRALDISLEIVGSGTDRGVAGE